MRAISLRSGTQFSGIGAAATKQQGFFVNVYNNNDNDNDDEDDDTQPSMKTISQIQALVFEEAQFMVFDDFSGDGSWKPLNECKPLQVLLGWLSPTAPTSATSTADPIAAEQMVYDVAEDVQLVLGNNGEDGEAGESELDSFLCETQGMDEGGGGGKSKKRKLVTAASAAAASSAPTPSTHTSTTTTTTTTTKTTKPKKGKKNFTSSNSKKWIYLTGLPPDVTPQELVDHFKKCGVFTIDPLTLQPKIKIYRDKTTDEIKGDGTINFAREESVALAIALLDEVNLRPQDDATKLRVMTAEFTQKGDKIIEQEKDTITDKQRKVAKTAARQAVDWDEGENGRIAGGEIGLTIVVLKNVFCAEDVPSGKDESNEFFSKIEETLRERLPALLKLTVFSKHREGVIICKFKTTLAANECLGDMNNMMFMNRRVAAHFWDLTTDYSSKDFEQKAKEEEKRLDNFGDWLDQQELPEELRVKHE